MHFLPAHCSAKKAEEDDAEVCTKHINLTMGEIDKFEYTVDHGITECNERVHTTEGKTIYYLLE